MNTLHIAVVNKVANYQARDGDIVCGNSDYQIEFAFDSEWDSHTVKTARFVTGGTYQDVVFEGNLCKVPIIKNTTVLHVGVYAGSLQTSTPAKIGCKKSILCDGGLPADPTPDVYSQILDMLNARSDDTEYLPRSEFGNFIYLDEESGEWCLQLGYSYITDSELRAVHDLLEEHTDERLNEKKAEIVNEVVDAVLADYEAYLDSLIAAQEATITQMSELAGD